jgi:hypothetical protein
MGEEKRHQMMQNLFGDQSEEEEEVDSEHESNPQPNYVSVRISFLSLERFIGIDLSNFSANNCLFFPIFFSLERFIDIDLTKFSDTISCSEC